MADIGIDGGSVLLHSRVYSRINGVEYCDIGAAAAGVMFAELESIQCVGDVSFGEYQRMKAMIPKRSVEDMYEKETDPYWLMYAAALEEYKDVFAGIPEPVFVSKKRAG